MQKNYNFSFRFVLVTALLGFFSPSIREGYLTGDTVGIQIKIFSRAEARRGGGGRGFRGGGMRSRPSVSRGRNFGGNFHRAPRPVAQRPAQTRPVTARPGKKPSIRPAQKPGGGKPTKPGRPANGDRPQRPNGKPVTIQPIVNPGTGKPMPGRPGAKPPGQRPPGMRPPGQRPPHGKPPHGHPPHRPPHHGHPGWHDDWWIAPAAVTAAIVIGSVVTSLPSGCEKVLVDSTTYYLCSGTYYLPYYEGDILKYKVVEAPK